MTTKPIRPRHAWAITKGSVITLALSDTRRGAIESVVRAWEEPWRSLYREGFRATKVVIQPR